MTEKKRTILVVEDNPLVLKLVKTRLEAAGYAVATAENSTKAIKAVSDLQPDLMILDLSLVDDDPFGSLLDGLSLLAWLRRTITDLSFPVIIHTVDDSPRLEHTAKAAGIYAVCRKAGSLNHLVATVNRAFSEAEAA